MHALTLTSILTLTQLTHVQQNSFSPSPSLSLLSEPVEKPHLYDDIQHRIKAHVRPSSAYTTAAKKGSIQPHTLMQPCTHTGRDTTACAHIDTYCKQASTNLFCVRTVSYTQIHAPLFLSMLDSFLLQTKGSLSPQSQSQSCTRTHARTNTHTY